MESMVLNSLSEEEEHSLARSEPTFTFLGEMTSSNEADSAIMLSMYRYPCFHSQRFSYNVSVIKSHSLLLLIYITISSERQWGSTLIYLNEITLTSSIWEKTPGITDILSLYILHCLFEEIFLSQSYEANRCHFLRFLWKLCNMVFNSLTTRCSMLQYRFSVTIICKWLSLLTQLLFKIYNSYKHWSSNHQFIPTHFWHIKLRYDLIFLPKSECPQNTSYSTERLPFTNSYVKLFMFIGN